jgi:hypothetical protein
MDAVRALFRGNDYAAKRLVTSGVFRKNGAIALRQFLYMQLSGLLKVSKCAC